MNEEQNIMEAVSRLRQVFRDFELAQTNHSLEDGESELVVILNFEGGDIDKQILRNLNTILIKEE